jgi:hypothetical protein
VRAIPSIFLTAIIFAIAILNQTNFWFGAMSFIIAYLLYEADFFSGIADIKIMVMIGFLISSINYLLFFIGLTVVFGVIWKAIIKWRMKNEKETAFIPTFLFVYIALALLGGLA